MHGDREGEAQAWLDQLLGRHAQSLIQAAGYPFSVGTAGPQDSRD